MLLFALPYYLVLALMIWSYVAGRLRGWLHPLTGGVRVRQSPDSLRIDWPSATLFQAMLLGAIGAAFVMTFVAGYWMNLAPSAEQAALLLWAILAGGPALGAIAWTIRRLARPRVSEINLASRTVVVPVGPPPRGLGRRAPGPWTERFDDLLDVDVNNRPGRKGATQRQFPAAVVLHLRRGTEERAVCLCELMSTRRAEVLARWLLDRLPVTESATVRREGRFCDAER